MLVDSVFWVTIHATGVCLENMPFIHEIKLQFIPSIGGLVSGFDCNTKDLWQYTLKWCRQVDQSISVSVRRLSVTWQLPPWRWMWQDWRKRAFDHDFKRGAESLVRVISLWKVSNKIHYLVVVFLMHLWYQRETSAISFSPQCVNTLRLRQNGCHFSDDIFKCIFLNENV